MGTLYSSCYGAVCKASDQPGDAGSLKRQLSTHACDICGGGRCAALSVDWWYLLVMVTVKVVLGCSAVSGL